ncbi:MAG: hypothetical protein EON96_10465 [Caulobacteraceae bacterium]|nr:MAG: hypothetical protein EON96_10465 [Caulobacteraceae bacterium]
MCGRLIERVRPHVWTTSVLIGVGCVLIMLAGIVLLAVIAPDAENMRWVGETAAPAVKSLPVLLRELALAGLAVPLAETLLFFALPALPLRGFGAPAWLYAVLIGGLGWLIHGAGIHQIPHGLNFGFLALWYWSVWNWRGWKQAVLATTLAHGVWNAIFLILWFFR